MATKTIATATVRAVKRKLIPTRAAITLVSSRLSEILDLFNYDGDFLYFQTPSAINRVKALLDGKSDFVSCESICSEVKLRSLRLFSDWTENWRKAERMQWLELHSRLRTE